MYVTTDAAQSRSLGGVRPVAIARRRTFLGDTALASGVIAAMMVFQPAPAKAQTTNNWLGVNGTWTESSNWSLGAVPTTSDDVLITTYQNNPPAPLYQAFSNNVTINLPLAGIPEPGNVAADTVTFNHGGLGVAGSVAQWIITNRFYLESGRFENNSSQSHAVGYVSVSAKTFDVGENGVATNRGSLLATGLSGATFITNAGAFFNMPSASISGVVVNTAGMAGSDGLPAGQFGPQADKRQFYNAGSISGGLLQSGQMPIFAVNNSGYFWNVALAGQVYGGVQNTGGYFRNQYIVKGDVFVSGGTFINGEVPSAQEDYQGTIDHGIVGGQPVTSKLTVGSAGAFINRRGEIKIAVENQGTFTNNDAISANVVSSGTFNNIAPPAGSFGIAAPVISGTLDVTGGVFTNAGSVHGLVTVTAGTFANTGTVNGINVAAGGTATNSGVTSQTLIGSGVAAPITVSGAFRNLAGGQIGLQEFSQYAFNDRPVFVNIAAGGVFTNEAGGIVRSSVASAGSSLNGAVNGNFGTIQGELTVTAGAFVQAGTLNDGASVSSGGTLIFGGRLNGVNSDGNLSANLRQLLGILSNDGAVVFDGQSRDTIVLGSISGTGTVENRGGGLNGAVTFDKNQFYTGKTIVSGGFLAFNGTYDSTQFEVSGGASVVFNSAANTFFTGAVTGEGNFIKGGTGTLTVSSALANTGAVSANGGTLAFGVNGGMAQTAVLATEQSATVNLDTRSWTVGGLRGQTGEISGTGNITVNTAANSVSQYSGVISGAGRAITKSGAGTQEFYGANTYGGGTTIQAGVLKVGSSAALGAGAVTVEAGASLELGTLGNQAGADFTFDKVVTGAGGLIKSSTNTVTLTAASTYTGDTYVREGTLRLGGAGSIALASNIVVSAGATFDVGAVRFATNTLTNLNGNLVGGGGTLTLNFTTPETYSGVISDGVGQGQTFQLELTGGTLNLTGNNSFTGGIIVSGHNTTLTLGHNNAAGGANNIIYTRGTIIDYADGINNATAIQIQSNTTQLQVLTGSATQSGVISEDQTGRPLEKIGAGTLVLGNGMSDPQHTFTGAFTISAGTVAIQSSRNLGSDTATNRLILNGGTLDTGANVIGMVRPLTVSASGGTLNHDQMVALQGNDNLFTGQLTKKGAGVLVITGTSSGSGGIFVEQGALSLGHNSSAGAGAIVMNGGATLRARTDGMTIANNISIQGKGGVNLERDFAGVNYTISGNISGNSAQSNLLKMQDGTINLTGNNTFAGGVTLAAGTLGVGSNTALGAGTLSAQIGTTLKAVANVSLANNIVITQGMATTNQFAVDTNGFNMTLSGVISTNVPTNEPVQPGLTKNGAGTLTLTGVNTYRGATIVNAGTLVVNGSIANTTSVTIADGAKLGGNAAIPNLTVQNGATLSPGNSIGTVTVAGNLTLNAGSTTVIEIQQGQSDRINVGGTATIAGTLQLVALGGPYVFSTPYTIITSNGGRTGTFATVTTDSAFGVGVTSTVLYGANNVQVLLNAAPLTPVLATTMTNQKNIFAVATAMDRAVASGADASAFFAIYNQPTREALAVALNTLTGEVHTAGPALAFQASDQFLRTMLDSRSFGRGGQDLTTTGSLASHATAKNFTLWGALLGQTGRAEGSLAVGSADRRPSDGHMAFGGDFRFTDWLTAGVAATGGHGSATLSGALGSAKAGIGQIGGYAQVRVGAFSLGASTAYTSADVETSRAIPALGASAVRANYRVNGWSGRAEAMVAAFSSDRFSISPFVAIQGHSYRLPAFFERNGTSGATFGVASRARSTATSRTEVGARLDWIVPVSGSTINLYARVGWAHYMARDARFSGSLIGLAGSYFVVEGAREARNAALLTLGADTRITGALTIGARADAEIAAQSRRFSAAARINWAF